MVVRALDHVAQCYSAADGAVVAAAIRGALKHESRVTLSFDGVSDVPSSFINAALVTFLDGHSLDWIKRHIAIVNVSGQTADMIRRCLSNGVKVMHGAQAAA